MLHVFIVPEFLFGDVPCLTWINLTRPKPSSGASGLSLLLAQVIMYRRGEGQKPDEQWPKPRLSAVYKGILYYPAIYWLNEAVMSYEDPY